MNVIGIIQTDLNEFNVLFEQEQQDKQGGQQNSNDQQDESMFLNFLGDQEGNSSGGNQQKNNGQSQSGLQEMTVRIKGVPEGQKATFLQMYQIIQDAKETQDLEKNLTIVNRGEDQGQG
jgi:hypothetical protein